MRLDEKYDVIEEIASLGGTEDVTVPAWERSTGRLVYIHFLVGKYGPENNALMAATGRLAAEHKQHIFGAGDHLGHPYVVTDALPWGASLRKWVASSAGNEPISGPSGEQRLQRAGMWKIPVAASSPGESKGAQGPVPTHMDVPAPLPNLAGESTKVMPVMPLAERTRAHPAPPPSGAPGDATRILPTAIRTGQNPAPAPAAPSGPGEFTLMFQTPEASAPPDKAPANKQAPASPGAKPPGEFTLMLQGRNAEGEPATPTAEPTAASTPEPAGPGEFTRMMQAANATAQPVAPEPHAVPPPPSAAEGPSEVTRAFRAAGTTVDPDVPPAHSPSPPAPEAGGTSGEFTRLMQAASAAAKPAAPEPRVPAPVAAAPAASDDMTRTLPIPKLVSKPDVPAEAPPKVTAASTGPGEFTLMMQAANANAAPAHLEPPLPPTPATIAPVIEDQFPDTRPADAPAAAPDFKAQTPPPVTTPSTGTGEFTRMLQSLKADLDPTPSAPPSVPPASTTRPPDELTRMIRAAMPPAAPSGTAALPAVGAVDLPKTKPGPVPGGLGSGPELSTTSWPTPATPATGPGEFTRMMQAASSPPSSTGDFSKTMPSPALPAAQPAAAPGATHDFSWGQSSATPAKPASPPLEPGEFTRMMQPPQFSAPASLPRTSVPDKVLGKAEPEGEFTRLMRVPPKSSGDLFSERPAPSGVDAFQSQPARGPAIDEFSRVASGGTGSSKPAVAPKAAAAPKPAAAAPAPASSKSLMALVLVLGGLLLIAIIVILVFALRSH